MNKQVDEKALLEKQERKEIANRRIFWFLFGLNGLLLIYLAIQIFLLIKFH